MKNLLLLTALFVLTQCQTKTKKGDEKNTPVDTTTHQNKVDTTTHNIVTDTNKVDIVNFGDIRLGLPAEEVTKVLGQPDSKTTPVAWGADGLKHEDWTYKAKGIVLNLSADSANGKTIFSINAKVPCHFMTRKNMGIGSGYKEITAAYGNDIDPYSTNKTQITVGSIYGGIIFHLKDDKAETIFLGASAE